MLVIAHRGASAAHPENTPVAFEAADRMGADGVELDVRIDVDAGGRLRLVVHHDPLPADPSERAALPDLDDVLDACGDRMLVNVEIKNGDGGVASAGHDPTMAVVAPTVSALRRRGPSWRDRFLVSSFDLATVDHCRRIAPEFATAVLSERADDDLLGAAADRGHLAVHPSHVAVDLAFVERAHDRGLIVNVWTANDPDRLADLAALGIDGACTDVPDVALGVLGRTEAPAVSPSWTR